MSSAKQFCDNLRSKYSTVSSKAIGFDMRTYLELEVLNKQTFWRATRKCRFGAACCAENVDNHRRTQPCKMPLEFCAAPLELKRRPWNLVGRHKKEQNRECSNKMRFKKEKREDRITQRLRQVKVTAGHSKVTSGQAKVKDRKDPHGFCESVKSKWRSLSSFNLHQKQVSICPASFVFESCCIGAWNTFCADVSLKIRKECHEIHVPAKWESSVPSASENCKPTSKRAEVECF